MTFNFQNPPQSPAQAPQAAFGVPAPTPAAFGAPAPAGGTYDNQFQRFGLAPISNSAPPKPEIGNYICQLVKMVRFEARAIIFEYVVEQSNSGSPVGFKSSIYRDITNPKYDSYTLETVLSIAGVDVRDPAAVERARPFVADLINAGITQQVSGQVQPSSMIGRKFGLSVTASNKGPNAKGKVYNDEKVYPVTQ